MVSIVSVTVLDSTLTGENTGVCVSVAKQKWKTGSGKTVDTGLEWKEQHSFSKVNVFDSGKELQFEVFQGSRSKGSASIGLDIQRPGQLYQSTLNVGSEKLNVRLEITRQRDKATAKNLEKKILSDVKKTKELYEDPEFYGVQALFKEARESDGIVWKRPSEIAPNPSLFLDGVEAGDVMQGELGDCYFLGALSVVATRSDLLLPLFTSKHPKEGFYQVKFFKNGDWQYVTIDDRIPCKEDGTMLYAHCKDENEFWVPLIEKAYAKLHGCYEVLEGGQVSAALMDLTGEAAEAFDFTAEDVKAEIADGSLWNMIIEFCKEDFLMGCAFGSKDAGTEADTGKGILANHAYGLLTAREIDGHKLLHIRNPWGQHEWSGAWSDGSSEWTPSLIKRLKQVEEEDGAFWMCFDDFLQQFNKMQVLRLLQDKVGKKWHKFHFKSAWLGDRAGGSTDHPSWMNNPQYALNLSAGNRIFVSLVQPDARVRWKKEYEVGIGFDLIKVEDNSMRILKPKQADLVGSTSFIRGREVALAKSLPEGQYVLVPSAFAPGQESDYYLDVYTKHGAKCRLIDNPKTEVAGEWTDENAGGCMNHESWTKNPKYVLRTKGKSHVRAQITLCQSRETPDFVGLYLFGKYSKSQPTREQVINTVTFTNTKTVSISLDNLPVADGEYLVMPATFEPGKEHLQKFTLLLESAEQGYQLLEVDTK